MSGPYSCPACGGRMAVFKQMTKQYGVDPRTGKVSQRSSGETTENVWMRCEQSCGEGPVYEDLYDDIANAEEAIEP